MTLAFSNYRSLQIQSLQINVFDVRVKAGSLDKTIYAFHLTELEVVNDFYKKMIQNIKIMIKPEAILSGQMLSVFPGILCLTGYGPS